MAMFIITFLVLLLAIIAMAIGVLNGRSAIKGSCGGINADGQCRFCGSKQDKCHGT